MDLSSRKKIDSAVSDLPDTMLERLLSFIEGLKKTTNKNLSLKSYSLKGSFDQIDVRSEAYE